MRWNEVGSLRCSVARTLGIVGDRWTMLVLRDAFLGVRRFADFRRSTGIPRHRLADRLGRLVREGILDRVRYSARPERFEYRLSEKGRDLYPVIVALLRWGDRWLVDEGGPPLELVHRTCGHQATPILACPACSAPIGPRDMVARLRPHPTKEDLA